MRLLGCRFRLLAAASVAAAGVACCVAASASASVIAKEYRPSKISAFDGVVVWSHWDALERQFRLVAQQDGRVQTLPIDGRKVPFDVDLGQGRSGKVVAAYSRCRVEPLRARTKLDLGTAPLPAYAEGRGCDIYSYDFATRTEHKLRGASTAGASEFLPSVWNGRVAFARVYSHASRSHSQYPYLYVRPLDGSHNSRRQPGGPRGRTGLPGPVSLDLHGHHLSFTWSFDGPTRSGRVRRGMNSVRLDTIGRGHRLVDQVAWKLSLAEFPGTSFADGHLYYGFQRSTGASLHGRGPHSVESAYFRYTARGHRRDRAPAPAQLVSTTRDAHTTYSITSVRLFLVNDCGCKVVKQSGPDF